MSFNISAKILLSECEADQVAAAVCEYYSWFIGEEAREPHEVMESLPNERTKRSFLERCDDLVTVMGFIGPLHDQNTAPRRVIQHSDHQLPLFGVAKSEIGALDRATRRGVRRFHSNPGQID